MNADAHLSPRDPTATILGARRHDTTRHYEGELLYRFGFGLSYATFRVRCDVAAAGSDDSTEEEGRADADDDDDDDDGGSSPPLVRVSCALSNAAAGPAGDVVALAFLRTGGDVVTGAPAPNHWLVDFARVRGEMAVGACAGVWARNRKRARGTSTSPASEVGRWDGAGVWARKRRR